MTTAPSADELLAHTDWLLQLARALVGDAAAADVVQDTFEVALAQPPKREGPLRPWLGGVARNLARMTTRGRLRRERREQAVAVVATVPTPEELVARARMQQQVATIVLALPEPFRQTLLLRFFEGMTAAQIARAQGIPGATVRARLADALAKVRAQLDDDHGDRRRWIVLIAPLPIAAASSRAAVAATLAGSIVMTGKKIGIVVVVLALAAALGTRALGWWGGGDTVAPPVAAIPNRGSAKPIVVAPAAAAPATGMQQRLPDIQHDDDPHGTIRLEGQVIDDKDQPVGGAHVAIDANPPKVIETEADGSFAFDGLIARDYRLEATVDRAPADKSGKINDDVAGYAGPVRLRLGPNPEAVTLRMRKGGVVEVAVQDGAGAPIKDAVVELRSTLVWHATTNAEGVATMRGVGPVWAPLAARAAGFAPAAMMVSTSGDPAMPVRLSLVLAKGAAIAGKVVDDTGKPVGGARVVATSASEPFPVVDPRRDGVETKPDGTFTVAAVSAGTWRVTATRGDHAPITSPPLTVDGVHPRGGVELVLAAGATIRGVVKTTAGAPVASADVRVVVRGYLFWRAQRQAFTGADGTFTIAGLPRRPVDVVAAHGTGASAIATADLVAKREHELALTLDITGAIDGLVVDRAGEPIGDAQVIAEPEWSGGVADREAWSVRGIQETVTDQGGAFRFAGLPEGSYRVRAARPGAPESALDLGTPVSAKLGAKLKIVLQADGTVVGKVAFADGKPARAFTVALGSTQARPFASADGTFSLPAVAGTHMIVIDGRGFLAAKAKDVTITEGKPTDVGTITVQPGRSVSGRVLDETGVPVVGAKVAAGTLLTGGGAELYMPEESIGAKDAVSDANGRFTLEGFSPASITILAGKEGMGRSASVRVPGGADSATVDLVLQPTTGLEGIVTRDGKPLADAIVIANPVGATSSNFFVATGPDGTFALDALAAGAYLVYPMIGGGGMRPKDMYMRRVDVVVGTRAKVTIDATPGPIALTINVKSAGAPVGMAAVFAIEAVVEGRTMDELRDASRLPGDKVVPMYIRQAMGGTTEIAGARPGTHTICAVPVTMPPPDDMNLLPMFCMQAKLAGAKQVVELVVPAKPK